MTIPLMLHAVLQQPLAFGVLAFVAGALIAPSITAQSVLVSRLAPAKYATEAFTWSSTFIVSGLGAGMALGGAIVETTGLSAVFVLGQPRRGRSRCTRALCAPRAHGRRDARRRLAPHPLLESGQHSV